MIINHINNKADLASHDIYTASLEPLIALKNAVS